MSAIIVTSRKSFLFLFFMLIFVHYAMKPALASSECEEASPENKYWEYQRFLIDNGQDSHGNPTGRLGLAKGNNGVRGSGVNRALDEIFRRQAGWDTKEHYEAIEKAQKRLFYGPSGLLSKVWLEIAKHAVLRYDDQLDNNDKVDVEVWGRINQSHTAPNDSEFGFEYNEDDGSGHIWATMCFEVRFQGTADTAAPDLKIRYSLKTVVEECGFRAIRRQNTMGPKRLSAFPGSYIDWPNSKVPVEFTHKLEAVNFRFGDDPPGHTCPDEVPTGGNVKVGTIFFDRGFGTLEELPNNTENAHFYQPQAEACLDMFFQIETGNQIPEHLDDDDRPNYCLGRCSDPPIANSGM